MVAGKELDLTYNEIVNFHGHSCPGLAIGYRMTKAALAFLSGTRATDEELVALVENDACGVDALQYLSGCTFGKGNLIFKDYGKHVYTLYNRNSRKGVRVVFNFHSIPEGIAEDRDQLTDWLLAEPEQSLLSVREVKVDEPEPARVMKTVTCSLCGESVMETRIRAINAKPVCIPCADRF